MTENTKERLNTAWEATHARIYGEPHEVRAVRAALDNNLHQEIQRVVDSVNYRGLPGSFGTLVVSGSGIELEVAWTGTTACAGVRRYDNYYSGNPPRWYWSLPDGSPQNVSPHDDPISALIEMMEALESQYEQA